MIYAHRPLVLRGLVRNSEIAEREFISGESGDTDSPEVPPAIVENYSISSNKGASYLAVSHPSTGSGRTA
jgi:hypothetical protein